MADLEFLTHLPLQRDLLARVLAWYEPDPRVLGLMLYGSLSEDTADEFSDIDLDILVGPEHRAALLAEAPAAAAGFGPVLYSYHDPDDPAQFFVYYDNHVKLDLDFMLPGRLSLWIERRRHRIFKDTTGEMAEAVTRSAQLPIRYSVDPSEVERLDAIFWVRCADIAAKATRGEMWRAREVLERLRGEALTRLAAWLDGLRPTGYRRIESRVSPRWLEGWTDTVATPDAASVLAGLAAMITSYTRLRDALAGQLGLALDPASEQRMRDRLIALGVPLKAPA